MLGRNIVYNIVGSVIPVCVSIVVIPPYIHAMGSERFGILALIWLVFGYFGLFDFGLSRATANSLAKIKDAKERAFSEVFWTAFVLNASLGLVGSFIFYLAAPMLLSRVAVSNPAISIELAHALPWVAALIPLATIGGVFTGVMDATERFFIRNALQALGALLFQPLPLLAVMHFGPSVTTAVISATVGRAISVIVAGIVAVRVVTLDHPVRPRRIIGRELLGYGGWVALTNLIAPILVSADQVMIGSVLGAGAVTYYSVPYSFAMKALILPGAIMGVLFPRMSGLSKRDAQGLAAQASITVGVLLALVVVPAIFMSDFVIEVWINKVFSAKAAPTAKLLFVATWINGMSFIPYTLLQSQGRPDLVAKYQAAECIPFLMTLWMLMKWLGLIGAALAWTLRVLLDWFLLVRGSESRLADLKQTFPSAGVVVAAWLISTVLEPKPLVAFELSVGSILLLSSFAYVQDGKVRLAVKRVIDMTFTLALRRAD